MSNIVHTCSWCVPIDASILKVYAAMVAAISQSRGMVIDDALSGVSKNPVENRAITNALASKYTKPASGIPAEDIAEGVIPDVSGFITKSVNDLVNYYLKSETYNRSEVQELIGAIQGFSYEVVASLPTASASTKGKIYLVPSGDPQAQNVKDEFITIDNGASANPRYTWEQIGSTSVDLSGYVTTTRLNTALAAYTTTEALTALLAAKQDTISDLSTIRSGAAAGATAYQKPQTGIPASDLASGVIPTVPTDIVKYSSQSLTDAQQTQARTNIGAAAAAALTALETAIAAKYTKPSSGIPETDLEANVQSALVLARSAVQSLTNYYTKDQIDDITAAIAAAVNSNGGVVVTALPTAASSTLGNIYYVGPDSNGYYDRYVTSYDGSSYSWIPLGNTEINLANYATKAELSQLQQEVNNLSGKYYGLFTSSAVLPSEITQAGYAFVGSSAPFAIWNFDGSDWSDTGATVDAIHGEEGVGFQSVSSQQDGTIVITLTNGDTVTIDLNHNHPQYLKYQMLQSESAMPATPESDVLYMWPEE